MRNPMKKHNLIGIALILSCGWTAATEYNLATDFSTTSNPNGVWTYGWFHNTLPGGSSLEVLSWGANGWADANGVEIWKNETGSAIGNVAPGQVAMNTVLNEPAVIRWIAPAEIGLATIQIDGELPPPISGIEIRRGAGVVLSVTNTSTFSVEFMVEPGDEIDFVAINGGTKPLDLTITTLKEHLTLTTFDDFDRDYPDTAWSSVPDWGSMTRWAEGSPATNYYVQGLDVSGWAKGEYREMPFSITTNTSLVSFRHIGAVGEEEYYGAYGAVGLRFCDDTIATGDTRVVEYQLRVYPGGGDPINRLYFIDGEGVGIFFQPTWNHADKVEFRADMDF